MATEPDPYRTLGLGPTASLAEVKAAYRRLAKANHPDAAGAAALPRFLAIQAAYERLAGPTPGRRSSAGPAAAPRKAWEADPERRDATYRAYGGRGRRGSTKSSGAPNAKRPTGSAGSGGAPGSTGSTGSSGSGGASSESAGSGDAAKRPKKATLGSTSYDGTDRDTFEPDWGGASWYGTTSGTYWTINPKEYADPRKHGPEYQARARRAARNGSHADVDADEPSTPGVEAEAEARTAAPPEEPDIGTGPGTDHGPTTPRHTTSSWWESTSGAAASAREAAHAAPAPPKAGSHPRPRPTAASPSTPPPMETAPSISDVWRALATGPSPSLGWRIARAIVAWIPIALAIGWASGELTGCGRFSATCDPGSAPLVWVLQGLVLVALLALPTIAGWGVVAAVVCLAVAVPATLFVTASAGAEASRLGTAFLGVVLGLGWLIGIAWAAIYGRRSTPGPTGPVS